MTWDEHRSQRSLSSPIRRLTLAVCSYCFPDIQEVTTLIVYELVDRNLNSDLVCCDRPRRWIDLIVQRLFRGSKSSFRSLTFLINQNLSFEENY